MSMRALSNQSFYNTAATLSYIYWVGQILAPEDSVNLAYYLSQIESSYITFDKYISYVAQFKFNDPDIKFYRVIGKGNVLYIVDNRLGKIIPLLMFIGRQGVIENTIEVCGIQTAIPDFSILEEVKGEEDV